MSMILSPCNMNIVQDFSSIVSTNVKQQILEPSLTVSPNATMLDAVTPEDITKTTRNFEYSICTENSILQVISKSQLSDFPGKKITHHTTLQTGIQANGTIGVASAISRLRVENI